MLTQSIYPVPALGFLMAQHVNVQTEELWGGASVSYGDLKRPGSPGTRIGGEWS